MICSGWGINCSCAVLESSVPPFLESSDDQENFKNRLTHCQGQSRPRCEPTELLNCVFKAASLFNFNQEIHMELEKLYPRKKVCGKFSFVIIASLKDLF